MAASAGDPSAAAHLDYAFHDELVGHCDNDQLLAHAAPAQAHAPALRVQLHAAEEFVSRSVGQHWRIIEALERGDTDAAAEIASANFRDSLPGTSSACRARPWRRLSRVSPGGRSRG